MKNGVMKGNKGGGGKLLRKASSARGRAISDFFSRNGNVSLRGKVSTPSKPASTKKNFLFSRVLYPCTAANLQIFLNFVLE